MLGGWFGKQNGQDNVAEGDVIYLPELPSPTAKQEFDELASKCLEDLLKLEREDEDDGWIAVDVPEEGVELWEKPDSSGFAIIKTTCTMPAPPKRFFEWIYHQDIIARQRWEPDLAAYKILEEVSESCNVIYRNYTAPYGVAPREFVALNARCKMPDGSFISYGRSINHPKGKANPKFVRGNAIVSGMIVRPIKGQKNRCHVMRIAQLDPRGMIPGWVISLGKKRAATNFARLRTVAEDDFKKLPQVDDEEEVEKPVELPAAKPSAAPSTEEPRHREKRVSKQEKPSSHPQPVASTSAPVTATTTTTASSNDFPPMDVMPVSQMVISSAAPVVPPSDANAASMLLQQTYNHQVSQLVSVLQAQQYQRENQTQSTLRNIELMLTSLQSDSKSNSEQIKNISTLVASQKGAQEQLSQSLQQQIMKIVQRKIGIFGLRLDTLFLIFAWPFVASFIYEVLKKRFLKK